MDRQARRLDEAGLIARCERVIPGRDERGVSWGRRAVEVYRRARAARGESIEPSELWFAIESDRTFRYPAMRLAELSSARQPRTFAYLFTWRSPFAGGTLGACHALELPFVFGTLGHPLLRGFTGSGPEAAALAERIQDAWIAFARAGNPSHPALPEWPGYDPKRRATMILGPRVPRRACPPGGGARLLGRRTAAALSGLTPAMPRSLAARPPSRLPPRPGDRGRPAPGPGDRARPGLREAAAAAGRGRTERAGCDPRRP